MSSQDIQLLTDELQELNEYFRRNRNTMGVFIRNFRSFTQNSQDFFRNWRQILNQTANPPAQPPASPNTSSTATPATPPEPRRSPFEAIFLAQGNALLKSIQRMDDIQARAMATNTTLQKMDIPNLGIRMSKLAGEILDLREIGFKSLDKSTLGLMSTMKLTNQSTQSLKTFLGNTSLSLRLNSSQVQNMSQRLGDTAVAYGMSQDRIFQAVNKLSESIETASLFGKGGQTAEALGEVAAMIGDRATDELGVVAKFLTGIGNESQAMMAGIFDIQNRYLEASREEQAKLTIEAVKTFNSNFRKFTEGLGTGAAGRRAAASYAEQLGGMGVVRSFQAVEAALMDSSKATGENNQKLATLKTFEERYANSMEISAKALQEIVTKLPGGAVSTAGAVAGAVGPLVGAIGTGMIVKNILGRFGLAAAGGAARGAFGGPLGMILGALTGITGTLLFSKDLLGSISDSSKGTNAATQRTNQILDPSKESPEARRTMTLIDVINSMVKTLGPQADSTSKESLQVQKDMALQLAAINQNIATRSLAQPATFGIPR